MASHIAHTKFYLPAHATNFPRNAIGQPHSSYPIQLASGMPLATHIAHTKLYLPAHIANILSYIAHIQFYLPQECQWPAI